MLCLEIPYGDPLALCAIFAQEPWLAFLDSSATDDPRANYSWLAIEPFQRITADMEGVKVNGRPEPVSPFDVLERALAQASVGKNTGKETSLPVLLPFRGGAVGYLGYVFDPMV